MKIFITLLFCLPLLSNVSAQQSHEAILIRKADSLFHISPVEAENLLLSIAQDSTHISNLTLGRTYRMLANICRSYSRKAEELRYLIKSYESFKLTDNIREVGEAERLIGQYYFYMKLYKEARRFLTMARVKAQSEADTILQINTTSNLAQLEAASMNLDQAITLYYMAIHLAELKNYRKGLLENWNRISYTFQKTKQPEKMLEVMRRAMWYAGTNSDTLGILYGDLGRAYMENLKYDSADYFLQKGLKSLEQSHNLIQRFLLMKFLAELRTKQGRYAEAISLLEQYDSLRIVVFTDQLQSEVGYSEARYRQLSIETQLAQAEARTKLLQIITSVSLISCFVMLLVVFLLRRSMVQRKKQKAQLDEAVSKLTRSEQLLRQLFEEAPSLIFTHTVEGKIISTNRIVHQVLGDEQEIKHLLDIISAPYHSQFHSFVDDLKTNKESSGWFRLLDRHSRHRIFRYESKLVDDLDKPPYVITFALDDSEVFKARSEAELERLRLLSVMQNSPDIHAILKPDATIEFISQPDFFDGHDSTGKNVLDYVSHAVGMRLSRNLENVFVSKSPVEFEDFYKDELFSVKLIPITSMTRVTEVLAIASNITDKRNQEDREKELNLLLEKNEKRYRSLVESSQVLICSHDLNGYLITVNLPGAVSMGYTPEQLIGHHLDEFVAEEFKSQVYSYLDTIKRTGIFEGFLTVSRKDGERRIFLFRNVVLKDEAIILGSAQDVTEWKKAEYREKLTRQELQQAKDAAEESNRLKSIFLGSLSHEVRTPLQGILGFAEILDSPGISETKRKEYLSIIKRRTYDMQNIIESLLDIASVETGELRAVSVEMNLYEYAELIFSKVTQDYPFLKNVQITLDNRLSPNTVVCVDPQHLNQVLVNLLRNAIKFTNEGVINISFEKESSNFLISVSDTGIGIAEDKLDHIFKPFRQAHEGISRSKGGIGLGLAISKKMVDLWHGKIGVTSQLGIGSTFSITIPITPLP